MSKNDETPSSKRWQKRRTAVALSVGTCLVMGILALEITRQQTPPGLATPQTSSGPGLIVLKNPEDRRIHRDLSEIEAKMHETKRLLFARDNALESGKLQAVREKLQGKTLTAKELEQKNDELKRTLAEERQKLSDFEKTTTALLDTIELQKNAKEQGRQKLMDQIDQLRAEHDQERNQLQSRLDSLQEREDELTRELSKKEDNLNYLYNELDAKSHAVNYSTDEAARMKESAARLENEISTLHRQLENHEQTGFDLERTFDQNRVSYETKIGALESELEMAKRNFEAESLRINQEKQEVQESVSNYKNKIDELESLLSQKDSDYQALAAKFTDKSNEKEQLAYASENVLNQAGKSLTESEDTLALERTYSEVVAYQLRQKAVRDEEEKLALEQNLEDLRTEVEKNQSYIHNLEKELQEVRSLAEQHETNFSHTKEQLAEAEQNIQTVSSKHDALVSEKNTIEAQIVELQNRPPEVDRAKEEELTQEIATLRSNLAMLNLALDEERQQKTEALDKANQALSKHQELLSEKSDIEAQIVQLQNRPPEADKAKEAELTQEIVVLKENLAQLNLALEQERQQKANSEKELNDLVQGLDEASKEREEMRQELDQQIASLKVSLGELNDRVEQERNQKEGCLRDLDELSARLEEVRREKQEVKIALEQEIGFVTLSYNDANFALEKEKEQKERIERELSLLNDRLDETSSEKNETREQLEGEISFLKQNLRELAASIQTEKDQKNIFEQELRELTARLDQASQEKNSVAHEYESKISALQQTLQDLNSNVAHENDQKQSFERELRELSDRLEQASHEKHEVVEVYENKVNALSLALNDLNASLASEKQQKEVYEKELQEWAVRLEHASQDKHGITEEYERKMNALNQSLNELSATLSSERQEKETYEQELYQLSNRLDQVSYEKHEVSGEYETKVNALNQSLNDLSATLASVKEQNDSYEDELNELSLRLGEARRERHEAISMADTLKNAPPVRDRTREEELERELEQKNNELNTLRNRVDDLSELSEEIETLSDKLLKQSEKNEKDLTEASEQVLKYRERVLALEDEIERLQRQQSE